MENITEIERIKCSARAQIIPFMRPLERKNPGQKRLWIHGVKVSEDISVKYLDQHREGRSTVDYEEREKFLEEKFSNGFKPDQLAGSWMYGGILYDHFGHFLSESVHRLWAWKHLEHKVDGIIFLTSGPRSLDKFYSYVEELFTMWDIDASKIRLVREVTDVDELHIPECGSFIGEYQPAWYKDELKNIYSPKQFQDSEFPEKVVFSRKNFLTSGKLIGFSVLEKLLEDHGYKIVCPENCSLEEQIKYISNSRSIVWEESSNLHLLDVLPQQDLDACVFKRRRGLKTFDCVADGKVGVYHSFDMVKQLANPSLNISRDIDNKQLDSNSVNRLSLSTISRLKVLRNFMTENMGLTTMKSDVAFSRFLYDFLSAEYDDLSEFLTLTVDNEETDTAVIKRHLIAQYAYVRAVDAEASSLLDSRKD